MAGFTRKIGAERTLLMLPLNVVLVARARGPVSGDQLSAAFERLTACHRMLAVRVRFDDDGTGWYVDDGVAGFEVRSEERRNDSQWLDAVRLEYQKPFPLESGPLVRCAILESPEACDIVLCGHHVVCDGTSLGFLLRDLLTLVAEPDAEVVPLPDPPPIDRTTVPEPPKANPLARWITNLMNEKWAAQGIQFDQADMVRMHEKYWRENGPLRLLGWELDASTTQGLVQRCREEGVTINSAIWTAFLAAQHDVQPELQRFHRRCALAANTRDRLRVPVPETLGFYASSLTVKLPYSPRRSFWDSTREVHRRITREFSKTNIFRMLAANLIHPTLLDSFYFAKYDGLDKATSRKLLRKMGWHKVTYGYAITNVGRLDIPTTYGALEIESVYGPGFFSDVEEKIVGAITVGGKLSLLLSCNETLLGPCTANKLRDAATEHLVRASSRPRRNQQTSDARECSGPARMANLLAGGSR